MSDSHIANLEQEFLWTIEQRRIDGAKTYGEYKFLDNNTLDMMYEELADIVNYCLFTYVKLRMMEERIDGVIRSDSTDPDAELDPE